jgi:hypothetical protein
MWLVYSWCQDIFLSDELNMITMGGSLREKNNEEW